MRERQDRSPNKNRFRGLALIALAAGAALFLLEKMRGKDRVFFSPSDRVREIRVHGLTGDFPVRVNYPE